MANWDDWSLEDLKAAAVQTRPDGLDESIRHFDNGAVHLDRAQSAFLSQLSELGSAWQGKAAGAAIDDAQQTSDSMDNTRATSISASGSTAGYLMGLDEQRRAASQIPDVDTSWGHAVSSGGWGGLIGIGAAKLEQQREYDRNRDQAAKIVAQMDSEGGSQASTMRSQSWPTSSGSVSDAPPSSLPPVPGQTVKPGSSSSPGYDSPSGTSVGPGYTPVGGPGTSSNPDDSDILNGTGGHHPAHTPTTTTAQGGGGHFGDPGDPTVSQGGPGGTSVPATGPGTSGTTVAATPSGGGSSAAAGAAAAGVLGGAGLAGAVGTGSGPLGTSTGQTGRGPAGLDEEEGGLRGPRGGTAGLAEEEGGLRGGSGAVRGGAFGAGEEPSVGRGFGPGRMGSGGIGSGAGFAEGDGAVRGGTRFGSGNAPGVPANEELGAARGSALRGAGPGFGGEPVAGEAGGRMAGGYPMGAGGGRRNGDEEEAPMPDYLVETDDVWGDGAPAAPPVIGE